MLVSAVARLKRNEPVSVANWRHDWGWVGFTFVATGALACLLRVTLGQFGGSVLLRLVARVALLLPTRD